MNELIEKLETTLAACVEDHSYKDEDEAPLHNITIAEVKTILKYLKDSM